MPEQQTPGAGRQTRRTAVNSTDISALKARNDTARFYAFGPGDCVSAKTARGVGQLGSVFKELASRQRLAARLEIITEHLDVLYMDQTDGMWGHTQRRLSRSALAVARLHFGHPSSRAGCACRAAPAQHAVNVCVPGLESLRCCCAVVAAGPSQGVIENLCDEALRGSAFRQDRKGCYARRGPLTIDELTVSKTPILPVSSESLDRKSRRASF